MAFLSQKTKEVLFGPLNINNASECEQTTCEAPCNASDSEQEKEE